MTKNKLSRTRMFTLPGSEIQFVMRNDGVVQYYNTVDKRWYNVFYKAKDGRWMQIMSLEVYTSETLEALNTVYNTLALGEGDSE